MRRTTAALVAGLFGLLALLTACGTGLTGGSIPPGTVARASGIIIRGDNASQIVPNAQIRFQPITSGRQIDVDTGGGTLDPPSPPDLGDGGGGGGPTTPPVSEVPGTVLTSSNIKGEFSATQLPFGPVRVIVTPPAETGLATTVYTMQIAAGDVYYLIAAPTKAGLSTVGLTGIAIRPDTISLQQGQNVQIQVTLQGGAPPTIVPSYLVKGDMGVVNIAGKFTAVRPGSGSIRVVVGPYEDTIPVAVVSR